MGVISTEHTNQPDPTVQISGPPEEGDPVRVDHREDQPSPILNDHEPLDLDAELVSSR